MPTGIFIIAASSPPILAVVSGMGFINSNYDIHGRNGESMSASFIRIPSFAWNVGAAAHMQFTENVSADLAYRYVGLGKNKTSYNDDSITTNPAMNEVSLGLRLTF